MNVYCAMALCLLAGIIVGVVGLYILAYIPYLAWKWRNDEDEE